MNNAYRRENSIQNFYFEKYEMLCVTAEYFNYKLMLKIFTKLSYSMQSTLGKNHCGVWSIDMQLSMEPERK